MSNLTQAHRELYRRGPDECFADMNALWDHAYRQKQLSRDHWCPPQDVKMQPDDPGILLSFGEQKPFRLNDWSFAQLCRLAGVSRDTINRLTPLTAVMALTETLPSSEKPVQILTRGDMVRSVHGVAYTRLWDVELLALLKEYATDFQPPQQARTLDGQPVPPAEDIPFEPDPPARPQGTGLYCGEQDMFVFLIDPLGWAEIDGEAFAPGFFLWNSEVGRRTVGVQTFWFQAICQNHIVWDAVEVVEFTRKHTANVHDSLSEIRRIIGNLVEKRDQRRDGFAKLIRRAMTATLGHDADKALDLLQQRGITRTLAKQALDQARRKGALTIFSVVDALTQLSRGLPNAGERVELDQKAGRLLALAAS